MLILVLVYTPKMKERINSNFQLVISKGRPTKSEMPLDYIKGATQI